MSQTAWFIACLPLAMWLGFGLGRIWQMRIFQKRYPELCELKEFLDAEYSDN